MQLLEPGRPDPAAEVAGELRMRAWGQELQRAAHEVLAEEQTGMEEVAALEVMRMAILVRLHLGQEVSQQAPGAEPHSPGSVKEIA
jgi:hypothetical protein